MLRHRATVVLAVLGALDALYLTLYKLGWIGEVICVGGGSCAVVQASPYAEFLGIPTAFWGLGFYLLLTAMGILRMERPSPRISRILWGLAAVGVGYSTYLTWAELFVIRAICTWCVISYILILGIFALETWELLQSRRRVSLTPLHGSG